MKLSDVATVKTNFPDAHFWIIRRGALSQCGKPVREFNVEHIGIKIERTDILLPDYLYYALMKIHGDGSWKAVATGTLELVNIQVQDIKGIKLNVKASQGR
jgi:hypothetical protein